MSVIGVSPSDIVGGLRLLNKASSALKSKNGARDQYQAVKESQQALQAAIKALTVSWSSTTTPVDTHLQNAVAELSLQYETQEQQLRKFEAALGQASSPQKRHGIGRKLQWTFEADKDIRESEARLGPAYNATVLHILRLLHDSEAHNHDALTRHVSNVATNTINEINGDINNIRNQLTTLSEQLNSLATSRRNSQTAAKATSETTHGWEEPVSKCSISPASQDIQSNELGKSVIKTTSSVTICNLSAPNAARWISHMSTIMVDPLQALYAAALLVACLSSAAPSSGGPFSAYLSRNSVLGLTAAVLLWRCLTHLPMQISLLPDSSVTLEDAFGLEIRVPYQQCEQYEIFHGFLEFYFRGKPGLQKVLRKHYRLLLGGTGGHQIDRASWTMYVKPRARLAMAMLFMSKQEHCAKCKLQLDFCLEGKVRQCPGCKQIYTIEAQEKSYSCNCRYCTGDEESGPASFPEPLSEFHFARARSDEPQEIEIYKNVALRISLRQAHRCRLAKSMLLKALKKARSAVDLDNAADIEGAIADYAESCQLLQQVMGRSFDVNDLRKLSAIRSSYSNRIVELSEDNENEGWETVRPEELP